MEEKIYQKILKEVAEKGDLLFTEIEEIFKEENFEFEGKKVILHPKNQNLVLWLGWNEEALNIISKLLTDVKNIYLISCNPIEIMIHAQYLELPVAKGENYNYKKPHWFPVKLGWLNKK